MSRAAKAPAGDSEVIARQNSTIEALAEAIENICLATAASYAKPSYGSRTSGDKLAQQVMDKARADVRTALRAFVAPHLRLIEGGGHQEYEASIPEDDRVKCRACNRDRICADVNCPHWHEAIRTTISPPDDVA